MREYPRNRFVPNTCKQECARCGFDFLNSELVKEGRTGLMVCPSCYDPEHPQDKPKDRAERVFIKRT